jgi:rod shape-determining protein MreD
MGTPLWVAPPLLLGAALLQSSFFPALGFPMLRPDIVLQMVVIWALLRGWREALPWGFVGGLCLDLFSGAPFGTASLALVLVAFCCSAGGVSAFRDNPLLPVMLIFWGTVLYGVLYLFLLRSHEMPVSWVGSLRQVVVPGAIVNTAMAPFTYWILARIEKRTRSTRAVDW